jgi:hypothetical protein
MTPQRVKILFCNIPMRSRCCRCSNVVVPVTVRRNPGWNRCDDSTTEQTRTNDLSQSKFTFTHRPTVVHIYTPTHRNTTTNHTICNHSLKSNPLLKRKQDNKGPQQHYLGGLICYLYRVCFACLLRAKKGDRRAYLPRVDFSKFITTQQHQFHFQPNQAWFTLPW